METMEIVCPCGGFDEDIDASEHETCECGHVYDEHDRKGRCTIKVTVRPRRRDAL